MGRDGIRRTETILREKQWKELLYERCLSIELQNPDRAVFTEGQTRRPRDRREIQKVSHPNM